MNRSRIATMTMLFLLLVLAHAANPFLDAPDDKPVSARFRGAEWGDTIDEGEITARVVITRIAKMPWGAIYKVEFADLKSRAPQPRKIEPDYFVVTNDRIVLLKKENMPDAIKRLSAADKQPEFEPGDIYAITSGKFDHEDALWKTTIRLKGDLCVYDANHPSGHFKKVVWKKGVGLVEYSTGYGAMADGFRLKREK
jgi:hypothetical protein